MAIDMGGWRRGFGSGNEDEIKGGDLEDATLNEKAFMMEEAGMNNEDQKLKPAKVQDLPSGSRIRFLNLGQKQVTKK